MCTQIVLVRNWLGIWSYSLRTGSVRWVRAAYLHVNISNLSSRIKVASQALLDVSSANNPALGYGADGLVGLGFTSLSSIDNVINKTGASTGRSLLYNLFQDNPSEPNFIAFALQRSTDSSDTVQGSFSIGMFFFLYDSTNTDIVQVNMNRNTLL
jgi:hypothetical protein